MIPETPAVVLIEGIDRTGKSTVAHAVWECLRDAYLPGEFPKPMHFGVPPDGEVYWHFFSQLKDWERTCWGGFIVDRCYMSNGVYAGCLGGGLLQPEEYTSLDQMFANWNALLLLMVDSPLEIWKRVQQEKDPLTDHLSVQNLAGLQHRFQLAFDCSTIVWKGSYTLPQLVENEKPTEQLKKMIHTWRAGKE